MNKVTGYKMQACALYSPGISKEIMTTKIGFSNSKKVRWKKDKLVLPLNTPVVVMPLLLSAYIQGSLLYYDRAEPDAFMLACVSYAFTNLRNNFNVSDTAIRTFVSSLGINDPDNIIGMITNRMISGLEEWYTFYKGMPKSSLPKLAGIGSIENIREKHIEFKARLEIEADDIPQYMLTEIKGTNNTYIDWRAVLKEDVIDFNRRKPSYKTFNRRKISTGVYQRGYIHPKLLETATLYVDASGSVTEDELQMMIDSIYHLLEMFNIKVILHFFSNDVSEPYELSSGEELNETAHEVLNDYGGGTNIEAVVEHINEVDNSEFIMILSDMELTPVQPGDIKLGTRNLYWLNTAPKYPAKVYVGKLINVIT